MDESQLGMLQKLLAGLGAKGQGPQEQDPGYKKLGISPEEFTNKYKGLDQVVAWVQGWCPHCMEFHPVFEKVRKLVMKYNQLPSKELYKEVFGKTPDSDIKENQNPVAQFLACLARAGAFRFPTKFAVVAVESKPINQLADEAFEGFPSLSMMFHGKSIVIPGNIWRSRELLRRAILALYLIFFNVWKANVKTQYDNDVKKCKLAPHKWADIKQVLLRMKTNPDVLQGLYPENLLQTTSRQEIAQQTKQLEGDYRKFLDSLIKQFKEEQKSRGQR